MRRVVLLALALSLQTGVAAAQEMRPFTTFRQLHGETRLHASLEYAAGALRVAPGRPTELYRMDLAFDGERYRHLYGEGALLSGGALEFELHSVVGTRALDRVPFDARELGDADASAALTGEREAYFESEGFRSTPVYDGHALRPGNRVAGPAIVQRMGDSVVVPPDYEALVDGYLTMRLAPTAASASPAVHSGVEVVR